MTGAETGVSSVDVALRDEGMVGDVPLAHINGEYVYLGLEFYGDKAGFKHT